MEITVKDVKSRQELRQFIKFPNRLYKNNRYYVPPLFKSEIQTLSEKNPAFEVCEAKYWLAWVNNEIVGRVAGIIHHNYNQKMDKKYVRFGWLDFIENEEVLRKLMQAVEFWAFGKHAECIHGPLGFTTFDPSGMLIEGFNERPTSFSHYNFPYYSELIEKLGYKKDIDYLEYNIKVPESAEKYTKTAEIIKKRYNLYSAELNKKNDLLDYTGKIFQLVNLEYGNLYAFSELTTNQLEALKKQFITLLRLKYVSIVVNSANEVVGIGICMPSLTRALQKSKGRLFPLGIFRILYALRKNDTVETLLIAIHKDYRDKGINAIIFDDIGHAFIKDGITNIESNRELEHNNRVKNLWNKFEYRQHKRARCYYKYL